MTAVLAAGLIMLATAPTAPATPPASEVSPRFIFSQAEPKVLGTHTVKAAKHVKAGQPSLNCARARCFALTFDDGPSALTTPKVLAVLEKYHVHATFFVIGKHIAGNQALIARMARDGDEVGNHTWSHPDLTTLSHSQILEQVDRTQAAVESAGAPVPTLLRPPYGAVDKKVINDVPLPLAMWNEDPKDWQVLNAQKVVQNFEAGAQPGGVADLHDIYPTTAAALPSIIQYLQKKHYHLVTFTQLLHPAANAQGEFFGYKASDFKLSGE